MAIWRLVAHHKDPVAAVERSITMGRLAVGWGTVGDLREMRPASAQDISARIAAIYPSLKNSSMGGPSLWNFFSRMREGDLVIVAGGGRRHYVAEITGPYVWVSKADALGDYQHQRSSVVTTEHPDALWSAVEAAVLPGQNVHWTVACCADDGSAGRAVPAAAKRLLEGSRFDLVAQGVERNPTARRLCIEHHGARCMVCRIDFELTYGELGRGFIHVHHLYPLADSGGTRAVDPVEDLVPLCPNCHAIIHRKRPPLPVEDLRRRYRA